MVRHAVGAIALTLALVVPAWAQTDIEGTVK